eukprot:4307613-Lingulodinium_polyedra.AAC.1
MKHIGPDHQPPRCHGQRHTIIGSRVAMLDLRADATEHVASRNSAQTTPDRHDWARGRRGRQKAAESGRHQQNVSRNRQQVGREGPRVHHGCTLG